MPTQLPNGLILRSLAEGTQQDRDDLRQFYVDVFTDAYGPDDEILGEWIPDLLTDKHPTVTPDDIFVVVNPAQNDRIISATLLIPQMWHYAGIEIPVGRPELVGTRREARNQGLVRALFDAIHQRSADLGHMMQAITGIPYFYRQFGYAMAVELGQGGALPFGSFTTNDPKPDAKPSFVLRQATTDDVPQMMAWERSFVDKQLLGAIHSRAYWEFEMLHRNPKSHNKRNYLIIQNADGQDVGYVSTRYMAMYGTIGVYDYVVGDQASYLETIDPVLRAIRDYALANVHGQQAPYGMWFDGGLYNVIEPLLRGYFGASIKPAEYAWYIRVPDLVGFIRYIQPVLEQRLEGSLAHRYTGQLHLNFYTKCGLRMRFEKGKLAEVDDTAPDLDKDDASFPYLTFLNVMFGHRSARDLRASYPDVTFSARAETLLNILFPTQHTWVKPQY